MSRLPSPARSQSAAVTPRRYKTRRTQSVGSPARSTSSVKLSAMIQLKENNKNSFVLSPMPTRRSVLNDDTDIEEPRRKSWWKKLSDNSRDVLEVLNDNKILETNEAIEEFIDIEVLSQEKKNYSIDLPESSDGESINSIIIPQRKLFTQKDIPVKDKFRQITGSRETLAKLQKSIAQEPAIDVAPKNLFSQHSKPKSRPVFPAGLLNLSPNKTANKTKEITIREVKGQTRNLFGNRAGSKRKNMFADFIMSESEDEISEIQPKIFGFERVGNQPHEGSRDQRDPSTSMMAVDIEMDDWKMLPSSTMVENQLEDLRAASETPAKRTRLSKLSETIESEQVMESAKSKQDTKTVSDTSAKKNRLSRLSKTTYFENAIDTNNKSKQDLRPATETPAKTAQSRKLSKTIDSENFIEMSNKSKQDMRIASESPVKMTRLSKLSKTIESKNTTEIANKSNQDINIALETPAKRTRLSKLSNNSKSENVIESTNKSKPGMEKAFETSVKKTRLSKLSNTIESDNITMNLNEQDREKDDQLAADDLENNEVIQEIDENAEEEESESKNDQKENEENELNDTSNRNELGQIQDESEEGYVGSAANDSLSDNEESRLLYEENDEENKENCDKVEENISNKEEDSKLEKNVQGSKEIVDNSKENEVLESLDDRNQELEEEQNNEDESNCDKLEENISDKKKDSKLENGVQDNKEIIDESEEGEVLENLDDGDQILEEEREVEEDEENEDNCDKIEENISDKEDSKIEKNVQDYKKIIDESEENEVSENSGNGDQEFEEEQNYEEHDVEEYEDNSDKVEENLSDKEEDSKFEKSNQDYEEIVDDADENEVFENLDDGDQEIEEEQNDGEDEENEEIDGDIDGNDQTSEHNEEVNESSQEISENNVEEEEAYEEDGEEIDEVEEESQEEQAHNDSTEQIQNTDEHVENDEGEETPNVSHDTTGRHRKKDQTRINSPEVILHDKTKQMESFTVKSRNTSLRRTSIMNNMNIRPSLAPPRESTGVSEGSSAEGSGWDSHRTTRKTLRQTFGKDFSPRKSLRALVMEKSANRPTAANDLTSVTSKYPQANSTELQEASDALGDYENCDEDEVAAEPIHDVSKRTRQTTLEMYLQKIKKQNMERRMKIEENVKNSLKAPIKDISNTFKMPGKPKFSLKRPNPNQANSKSKAKQMKSNLIPLDDLPPEVLEDMKYKPPKRYQPSSAAWITKRLYKFLESKLESKYDYKARVRAEKLVEVIYQFAKELRRHPVACAASVDGLKQEMARLDIVKTHFDFYQFFNDFMPREIRVKVVPDVMNKLPMPRHGVFSDILRANTVQG